MGLDNPKVYSDTAIFDEVKERTLYRLRYIPKDVIFKCTLGVLRVYYHMYYDLRLGSTAKKLAAINWNA